MLTIGATWLHAASLNAVAPVVGGIFVAGIVAVVQRWRSRKEVRASLTIEMMRVAYGFYTELTEAIRRTHYGQPPMSLDELSETYRRYRADARVIETQLTVYFNDQAARWLWHGTVDMLNVRYYAHAFGPTSQRLADMRSRHEQHATEVEIPNSVRSKFPTSEELRNDGKVQDRFDEMLDAAIAAVLRERPVQLGLPGQRY